MLKCLSCKASGPVTSYLAVGPKLTQKYKAVVVNENFQEEEILAEGTGPTIFEIVYKEAGKGRLIWLQPRIAA